MRHVREIPARDKKFPRILEMSAKISHGTDMELDPFDHKLLALLEVDSRRTGDQLSELVGLSPAACLRRLQRLRKIGAIEREMAVVSPKLRGKGTRLFVLISVDRQNPKMMDELCGRLLREDDVVSLDSVTGDDDVVMVVDCGSMAAFSDLCDAYLNEPPVVGYKTLVSIKSYEPATL